MKRCGGLHAHECRIFTMMRVGTRLKYDACGGTTGAIDNYGATAWMAGSSLVKPGQDEPNGLKD